MQVELCFPEGFTPAVYPSKGELGVFPFVGEDLLRLVGVVPPRSLEGVMTTPGCREGNLPVQLFRTLTSVFC